VGSALDVPFVFGEGQGNMADYTADQLEQASMNSEDLAGVPQVSSPSDDEVMDFQVTGGGDVPATSTERRVGDLKEEFDARVEPDNPQVNDEAVVLALKYPGDLTIDQIASIYGYLKNGDGERKGWGYVRDPRGIDYLRYANASLKLGDRANCVGGGDCDDFAILMSALIESVGGTTRIILARNESTGGHAYTEVYLGSLSEQNRQVEGIIAWLQQKYGTDRIYTHIDTDTKDVWLNLDWGADEKGNTHPGGPFYQGDKHIVLCIRDSYRKTPLRLLDSYSVPAEVPAEPSYDTENVTINATETSYAYENNTIIVSVNATEESIYAYENASINETENVTVPSGLSGQVYEECSGCNLTMGEGLANWNLYLHQGYIGGEIIASAITNEYGYYSFGGIPDGDYVIELVLPYGWAADNPIRPVTFYDSGYSANPSEMNFAARRTDQVY
jgi:hypothetical protein